MNRINGFLVFLVFTLTMLNTSCRKEESSFVGTPPEERLVGGSHVANLLVKIATKDGSDDDIVDQANCISLKLPYAVIINNTKIIVDGAEDFAVIETLLDDNADDDNDENDGLEIVFPVTVVFSDYSETTVTNAADLQGFADQCQIDNDDDIECVDIRYPVTVSVFDTLSEIFDTVLLENDMGLYSFVEALNAADIANIDFPIAVILSNGTEIEVADLNGLENVIEISKDDCDEDDDNNFNDNDCGDCGTDPFSAVWAVCSEWEAHKFEIDGEKLEEKYKDLSFDFQENGVVTAVSEEETFVGNWNSNGSGNSVTIRIDIPGLDDFNATWNLKEIKQKSDAVDVRLYIGQDELHIQSTCSEDD